MQKRRGRARKSLRLSAWVFIVVGALVQLAAWNTGTNLLYIVSAGVLSFLVVSFLFSGDSLHRLVVSRETPRAVHRGEPFAVTLRVENRSRLFPAASLRFDGICVAEDASAYLEKVPAKRTALIRVSDRIPRRGVYPFPPLSVSSAFPLGLVRRRMVFPAEAEIVVYPRVLSLRPGALEETHGTGDMPRVNQEDGDEFFSLRDYIPGDDVRKIAWRVSARLRHLVVRELEPDMARNVFVAFDTRGRQEAEDFEEQFEDAVDLAASLAVSFLNRHYSVAVVTPEASTPLGEGAAHRYAILDLLARVSPASPAMHGDEWMSGRERVRRAGYILVSPDSSRWGRPAGPHGVRVLDPREVIRA